MSEERIELPGGGVAWITGLLTHEQANVLYRHWLRVDRYQVTTTDKSTGERVTTDKPDLTPEQLDDYLDLQLRTREIHVRTCVRRWEGVTDPDGAMLTFPDDVGRMRSDDFDALFVAVSDARLGKSLPNSTGPSSSGSTRGSGRRTR